MARVGYQCCKMKTTVWCALCGTGRGSTFLTHNSIKDRKGGKDSVAKDTMYPYKAYHNYDSSQ